MMRRPALLVATAIAAGLAGFWLHRATSDRGADEAPQSAAQQALDRGEALVRAHDWRAARAAALEAQAQAAEPERARAQALLATVERELSADALLSAGQTALGRGHLEAAALALQAVPRTTLQAARRDALEAALARARSDAAVP